jgi:hypothetical protein
VSKPAAFRTPDKNISMDFQFSSTYDSISSCIISAINEIRPGASHFRIRARIQGRNRSLETAAMIDSGATALFLGKEFVNRNNVRTFPLKRPIQVFNIDGTENRAGRIERCARLKLGVDKMNEWVDFLVTDLGGEDVILGLPWLREHNPEIDWRKGQVRAGGRKVTIEEVPDEEVHVRGNVATGEAIIEEEGWEEEEKSETEEVVKTGAAERENEEEEDKIPAPVRINANRALRRKWRKQGIIQELTEEVWCAAGFTYSQHIAERSSKDKPTKSFEELVPPEYRSFAKVFSEAESE